MNGLVWAGLLLVTGGVGAGVGWVVGGSRGYAAGWSEGSRCGDEQGYADGVRAGVRLERQAQADEQEGM